MSKELTMWNNIVARIANDGKSKSKSSRGRLIPLRQLRGEIFKIYSDKGKANRGEHNKHIEGTDGVALFATNYFFNKFGKKEIVEERLEMLVRTLCEPNEDPFIEDFAVMCGLRKDKKYSSHVISTFLACVDRMYHFLMPRPPKVKDPVLCLEHPKACELVATSAQTTRFVDIEAKLVQFDEALEFTTMRNNKGQHVQVNVIPADRALCGLVQLLDRDEVERKAWLAKVFEKFADPDSGTLNLNGFRRMMMDGCSDVDASREANAELWYGDAFDYIGSEAFGLQSFVEYAMQERPNSNANILNSLMIEQELLRKVQVESQSYVLDASQSKWRNLLSASEGQAHRLSLTSNADGNAGFRNVVDASVAVERRDSSGVGAGMAASSPERDVPKAVASPAPNMLPVPSMSVDVRGGASARRASSPGQFRVGASAVSAAVGLRRPTNPQPARIETMPSFSVGNSAGLENSATDDEYQLFEGHSASDH